MSGFGLEPFGLAPFSTGGGADTLSATILVQANASVTVSAAIVAVRRASVAASPAVAVSATVTAIRRAAVSATAAVAATGGRALPGRFGRPRTRAGADDAPAPTSNGWRPRGPQRNRSRL